MSDVLCFSAWWRGPLGLGRVDQLRYGAVNMPHPEHCSMKLILHVRGLLVSPDAFQDRLKTEDKGDHIRKGLLVSHTFKFCKISGPPTSVVSEKFLVMYGMSHKTMA